MKSFIIKLTTIADVQNFVAAICNLPGEFDLISGKYIVNAKSILGIFSLDIQNPLELKVYSYTENVKEILGEFIVEEL